MSEQAGFDPNAEQANNGERKGTETDFAIQLQGRLQKLAEKNPDTDFITGFVTRFEGDSNSFEVHVEQ